MIIDFIFNFACNVFGRVADQGRVTDQKYDNVVLTLPSFPASNSDPNLYTYGLNMGRACRQKDSNYEERMTKAIQAYKSGREPNLRAAGEIYDIK